MQCLDLRFFMIEDVFAELDCRLPSKNEAISEYYNPKKKLTAKQSD